MNYIQISQKEQFLKKNVLRISGFQTVVILDPYGMDFYDGWWGQGRLNIWLQRLV